jgi:hypothetical protein
MMNEAYIHWLIEIMKETSRKVQNEVGIIRPRFRVELTRALNWQRDPWQCRYFSWNFWKTESFQVHLTHNTSILVWSRTFNRLSISKTAAPSAFWLRNEKQQYPGPLREENALFKCTWFQVIWINIKRDMSKYNWKVRSSF